MKKFIKITCVVALGLLILTTVIYAHSGRTDSSGGHYNHSTGEYHYHHGYSAHDHYDIDGDGKRDCPYEFDYDSVNKVESDANEEEVKNTTKINKTFWSVCDDILVCFILTLIAFPFIVILLGFTALLPKKISNLFEDHILLVYIISFILTWLTLFILYSAFN